MARIVRVGVLRTSLVLSLVWFILSALFCLPLGAIYILFNEPGNRAEGFFTLTIPLLYLVFTFLATGLFLMVYNRVASFTGGIEVEIAEKESATPG